MIVSSVLDLSAKELSAREWKRLFTALTFEDAEGREVQSYRILKNGRVRLPRGAWSLLPDHVEFEDRRSYPEADWQPFIVRLDAEGFSGQFDAWVAMESQEQGLVIAQPGFGKTQVALHFIARCKTNTIVFVHTEDIFNQWVEYARSAIPDIEIGAIQGEHWEFGQLTIAMVQTVYQNLDRYKRWADKYGAAIIDEAHHAPARMWELILNVTPARYRIGFTATQGRADGMEPLMEHLIGPVIYRHKWELKVPTRYLPVKSDFYFPYRGPFDWHKMLRALVNDKKRNILIAEAAVRRLKKGNSVLILSRRIDHLGLVHQEIVNRVPKGAILRLEILTGKTPRPRRLKMIQDFREGKIKCLLATQLADEALDVPILSCVILTFPGKHDGRIIQQVGRALREHEGKEEAVIIDIVDEKIGVLYRQWKERRRAIKAMKIKIKKSDEPLQPNRIRQRREVSDRLRKRLRRR